MNNVAAYLKLLSHTRRSDSHQIAKDNALNKNKAFLRNIVELAGSSGVKVTKWATLIKCNRQRQNLETEVPCTGKLMDR